MRRFTQTHVLPNGRTIEVEAEIRGGRLRLRARLVDQGLVVETLRRDYRANNADAVNEFTSEFAGIIGIHMDLFPDDLFGLRCPAAPPHWPDVVVWGITTGTVEVPRVTPIPPLPLTDELIRLAEPCTPREVYRIAGTCIQGDCRHWRHGLDGAEGDGSCTLVERVVDGIAPTGLQRCGIRAVCRWFAQEGDGACRVCPGVVTDIGELPQDADSDAEVVFL
jgi:hypothetical protein